VTTYKYRWTKIAERTSNTFWQENVRETLRHLLYETANSLSNIRNHPRELLQLWELCWSKRYPVFRNSDESENYWLVHVSSIWDKVKKFWLKKNMHHLWKINEQVG